MTEPDAKAPTDRDAPAEAAAVLERYARRQDEDWRYHPLNPAARLAWQERQAAVAQMLRRQGCVDTARLRLTEVGCGAGGMLLDMLQLGFDPRHLCGIELIPQRLARARERLPQALRLIGGDATLAPVEPGSQDIVLQSTVFSSLLDDEFQRRLADAMWRWTRPGGAVLWYDFTVDNPRNPDVRGVPAARLQALFPQGLISARRVTLAPPIARAAVRLHPSLYTLLNALPLLRTHRLAWIAKPA